MNSTNKLMADGAPSYVIKSIYAKKHDGYGCDFAEVVVTIVTPNDLFKKLQKKSQLGSLFLDVSNEVYSLNKNIPAYNPTVSGINDRASKGIKTLRLSYTVRKLEQAKALGIECFEFKNGDWSVKYGTFVDLTNRPKPKLEVVR